jgi:GH24 family phage-related lysozyme (muramidase)
MDMTAVVQQLKLDEGRALMPYRDTGGHWVIGYGHLLTGPDHIKSGQQITPSRAQDLLLEDIAIALRACERLWPQFHDFPQDAQHVLLQTAFLVGEHKLKRFVIFRAAVTRQEWPAAATALRQSKLARQVKRRAKRMETQLARLGMKEPTR